MAGGARERPRCRGAPGRGWERRDRAGGLVRAGAGPRLGLSAASAAGPVHCPYSPHRCLFPSFSPALLQAHLKVRKCRPREPPAPGTSLPGPRGPWPGEPPWYRSRAELSPARAPRELSSERMAKGEENPLGSRWRCFGGPAPVRGHGGCAGLRFVASTIAWRGAAPAGPIAPGGSRRILASGLAWKWLGSGGARVTRTHRSQGR